MKKKWILAGFTGLLVLVSLANLSAQNSLILDDAIKQSAAEIERRLAAGSKIVILNFSSPSTRFSSYVIDKLTGAIVNGGKIAGVDRTAIDNFPAGVYHFNDAGFVTPWINSMEQNREKAGMGWFKIF
jgi:hypothetical protein